ncbi:helicase C-terminal domain-containing protein [Prosthecobacter algae]|jgi:ATP-dependent DNA helicase DinG|uniref:DNA 5'-3' helicase n=1 Tax=Prosthecobacter algae TaxID=1144682 RepID=A0ABP9PJD8_9BACT
MISILEASEGALGGPTLAERMHLAFSTEGKLALSPQFEYRPQQQRMAQLVAGALEKNKPLVVEAATGVGKSLAYLIPAVQYALEQGRKAIICTHTINLQEQLIHKDIPIVKKILGPFHAELLKGRSNYLCPTRLKNAYSHSGDLFSSSETAELQLIEDFFRDNPSATLSEMDFTPGARVWSLVCSEPHACTPRRCPPGSGCVYQDVRRRMAEADVLVLNHTLFFTLLASAEEGPLADDTNFIFPRDFVILDEAHTIENIAAKAFGIHVSESNIRFELGRLFNPKTRKGFFQSLGEQDGTREVSQCLGMVESFFRTAENACKFTGPYAKEFRVREPELVEDTLSLPLQRVARIAQKAGDAAKSEGQKLELLDIAKRLGALRLAISSFLDQSEEGHVYWAERSGGDNKIVSFHSAPIDVAPKLESIFFTGTKACVFTSATLGVGDDVKLNYFRKRVGAYKAQAATIESPFDFKKQMKLYLVKRMPEPGRPEYQDAMIEQIEYFLGLSKGRAFVLFTSYSQMTALADRIEDFCLDHGWRLLVQGRGMPRHQMLHEFKKDTHSILFGTDSFWTGVDVPGEALSNVIITRLPFAVPDHPVTASRLEYLEEQGLNSFSEYSVPEAILKLRQGVGRLIRTQNDKGMVVILDNRILTKPYGRAFMASLPDCPTEIVG